MSWWPLRVFRSSVPEKYAAWLTLEIRTRPRKVEGERLHLQDYNAKYSTFPFFFFFSSIKKLSIIVLQLCEMLDGFNFHAWVHRCSAQRGSCHSVYAANVLLSGTFLQKCFISAESVGLSIQQCTRETVMAIKIRFLTLQGWKKTIVEHFIRLTWNYYFSCLKRCPSGRWLCEVFVFFLWWKSSLKIYVWGGK